MLLVSVMVGVSPTVWALTSTFGIEAVVNDFGPL